MRATGTLSAAAVLLAALAAAGCASRGPSGGWLGVHGHTLEDTETGLPIGVEVSRIEEGSPLEGSGVRSGDLIVALDGEGPLTAAELIERVKTAGWERPVRLAVETAGEVREVAVVPAPGERVLRLGITVPGLFSWDERTGRATLLSLSVLSFGLGPDRDGGTLLGCVGWTGTPERADLWLGVVSFGTGFRRSNAREVEAGAGTEVGSLPR